MKLLYIYGRCCKNFYPYIPVGLLLKDKFDNKNKIKNINVPVLIMHGEADQIVPYSMGKKCMKLQMNQNFLILQNMIIT